MKNVRVTTRGGVLRPGEEVMQIVPLEEDLVIEAKVSPADIAFIKTIDNQTYTKIRTSGQDRIAHINESGNIVWQSPRGTFVSTVNQVCRLRSATRMADGKILMGGVLPQTPV